ncbi:fatty acid transporter protein [Diaporthe helianthi]|uniref:Fatty acid transporter protein n=1 Tax=Diaporthe helianthi TaxID=158607 RepID=A0A2P5HVW8_DIAHE|nr:fatty acid transporter protein [Diaporthe helianthi]
MSSIPAALVGKAVAAVAGLAYLNARFSIGKDLNFLLSRSAALSELSKTAAKDRLSIYYYFEDAVREKGDSEALWSHGECLTYNQTYARVNQYAQWFLAQGIQPGQFAALVMVNSPDMICAWFGLLAIGAAPALVNTNLAAKALIHSISIAKVKLVLADGDADLLGRLDAVRGDLEASGHRICRLGDVRAQILSMEPVRPGDELRKGISVDAPMSLAYTSGTTGLPKAISFPMVIAFLSAIVKRRGFGEITSTYQRCYNCMPYYHMTGGLHAILQLLTRDTLCIAPKFHARTFWDDIRASRATFFIYVGEALRYLLAQPPSPLDRAHNVHTILGNGLRGDVWVPFRDRFGIDTIHEFYNSTELMFGLDNSSRGDFTAKSLGVHGLILRTMFSRMHVPVATDAETGELLRDPETGFATRVPFDQGGEILVRLDNESKMPGRTFRGYWDNEGATSAKIARDVFVKGDAYFRTGDALRRDSDGRWYFCDRLGDTFRWKGENVSTTEVSEVLGAYGGGVIEAVVYGVQLPGHEGRAGAVALLIEESKRAAFDYADFLRYARANLPKYAVPIFIRLVSEPLSTGNHKQNKVPLKAEGVDPDKISSGDAIYWASGETYVPFTRTDWEGLSQGRARL